MNLASKSVLTALVLAYPMAGAACAATVNATAFANIFWSITSATDADGNSVDGLTALLFAGSDVLKASSSITTANTVASDSRTGTYTVSNTSSNIFINWGAFTVAKTTASSSGGGAGAGVYSLESNGLATAGLISSFSATTTSFTCTVIEPSNCGTSAAKNNTNSDFVTGLLAPGDSISFALSVTSFAKIDFVPAATEVPLPAAGFLLGSAVLGLGTLHRGTKRNAQR